MRYKFVEILIFLSQTNDSMWLSSLHVIKSSENLHFFIATSLSSSHFRWGCDKYLAMGARIDHMSEMRLEIQKKHF